MDYQFRPIDLWPTKPTPAGQRQRGRFKAGYMDTLQLLGRELRHLGAKHIIIQAYLSTRDIRNDGMIRADSRPKEPGVILCFESKHGPLMYPCDTFTDWQDNLRAIALGLEALRTVDRYGVTKRGEQYRGWVTLPPALLPRDQAIETIASVAGVDSRIVRQPGEGRKNAIRDAMKRAHPDTGGSHEAFIRVKEAAEILEEAI